jgi:hypothetical protein
MLVMGVDDRGVEPWGRLVDGGREGCERGSIVIFGPNGVDERQMEGEFFARVRWSG